MKVPVIKAPPRAAAVFSPWRLGGVAALLVVSWLLVLLLQEQFGDASRRGRDGLFATAWLQHPYWQDGKAELDRYEGTLVREGTVPQPAEVTLVFVRETFAPGAHVKADDWRRRGGYPVLKLNQVFRVRTGVYGFQQMHSSFWSVADGRLLKFSLTSSDTCGNTFKVADRGLGDRWKYRYDTYWEKLVAGEEEFRFPADGLFADELPARVRAVNYAKAEPRGTFSVRLAPSVVNSKPDALKFFPAKVAYVKEEGQIRVTVTQDRDKQEFLLEPVFPYRIREWGTVGGGRLRLKESWKIDYWNYGRAGDQERAAQNPALRLP